MTVESAIDDVRELLASTGLEFSERVSFPWLTNRAPTHDEGSAPPQVIYRLAALHAHLGGDWPTLEGKRVRQLTFDFLVDDDVLIEVDKYFHFTTVRQESLAFYEDLDHNLDIRRYRELCAQFADSADRYQRSLSAPDFAFKGGRIAQRAYFDAVKDLLAPAYGFRVVRLPAADDELAENIPLTLRVLL